MLTWVDRLATAEARVESNLGLAKTVALKASFEAFNEKAWSEAAANGVIVNLINIGFSNIEIRSLLGVGGSRVNRLRADPTDAPKKKRPPGHAVTAEDILRITSHMEEFPKEDAFPCAHRTARQYLLSSTDGGPCPTWMEVWQHYKAAMEEGGHRVISRVRWRQYVSVCYKRSKKHAPPKGTRSIMSFFSPSKQKDSTVQ